VGTGSLSEAGLSPFFIHPRHFLQPTASPLPKFSFRFYLLLTCRVLLTRTAQRHILSTAEKVEVME